MVIGIDWVSKNLYLKEKMIGNAEGRSTSEQRIFKVSARPLLTSVIMKRGRRVKKRNQPARLY